MTPETLVPRLLRLWDDVPTDDRAEAAFAELYTDPVLINDASISIEQLVARARMTAAALVDRSTEVLGQLITPQAVAVTFQIRARHVGLLPTPLGDVPGNGARIELRVIDVLMLRENRIAQIWMVADYLGALGASGALRLD
jgi:hypothetical protein